MLAASLRTGQVPQTSGRSYRSHPSHSCPQELRGRPVEVTVCRLEQPSGSEGAVSPVKAVQHRQGTAESNLEDRAGAVSSAEPGGPVEVVVGGLNQPGIGVSTISAVNCTKAVKGSQHAAGRHTEDRATATKTDGRDT